MLSTAYYRVIPIHLTILRYRLEDRLQSTMVVPSFVWALELVKHDTFSAIT